MKYIFVALFLLMATSAAAYNPVVIIPEQPYEEIIIPMDVESQKQSYLGTLVDFPHLYEFKLDTQTTLQIKVRQPVVEDAQPVHMILLSVNPAGNGLEEIIRQNTPVSEREEVYNSRLAISSYESEWLEVDLEPGVYRLEVSTPVNLGPYELDFGFDSVDSGYFGMFKTISLVQSHFGYTWTQYLKSTFILYQLGIILIGGVIWYTWSKRRQISHAT